MAPTLQNGKTTADAIVLGLGGMGSAALYQLAKRGVDVIGIEQFELVHARGSSHGQTRLIRQAYFEHADYVPLLKRAYELWRELEKASKMGLYHETGILYFVEQSGTMEQGILGSARKHGIELQVLSREEIAKYESRFRPTRKSTALFEPRAGYLEVENCVAMHLDQARKLGATVVSQQPVIEWSARPGEVEVKTARGAFTAKRLVIAAGAWSKPIVADLKLPLKLLRKRMHWLQNTVAYNEPQPSPCFFYETTNGIFYGFPDAGLGIKVAEYSGGEPMTDPATLENDGPGDDADIARIASFVRGYLPGAKPDPIRSQSCMYTMTPDEHFIVDLHPKHPNVAFAAGFSGHGFKFASVMGEILADLATTGTTAQPIGFLRRR